MIMALMMCFVVMSGMRMDSGDKKFINSEVTKQEVTKPEVINLEVYEIELAVEIIKNISSYIDTQILRYGFNNDEIIRYIVEEILVNEYKFTMDEVGCFVVGDPETLRPVSILIIYKMVFHTYKFEIRGFKVEEPKR
jgi:hypothetical protein